MQDIYAEFGETVPEKIWKVNQGLEQHREALRKMMEDLQEPKHDPIISQFEETMIIWKSLVEVQRLMFNKMEQQTFSNSIEVTGLPEEYGTDIGGVAKVLAKLLHISIPESYVVGFKRIEKPTNSDPQALSGPRPLVVELVSHNIKKRVLTVAESVVLSVIGSDMPMDITEHLTPLNKELLRETRHQALIHGVNNVWVEDGKIYVRRSDDSFIYEIKSEADIKQMEHY